MLRTVSLNWWDHLTTCFQCLLIKGEFATWVCRWNEHSKVHKMVKSCWVKLKTADRRVMIWTRQSNHIELTPLNLTMGQNKAAKTLFDYLPINSLNTHNFVGLIRTTSFKILPNGWKCKYLPENTFWNAKSNNYGSITQIIWIFIHSGGDIIPLQDARLICVRPKPASYFWHNH